MPTTSNRHFWRRRRISGRKSSFRPLLEQLEARRVLSATITVNSTADTNARDTNLTFREAILISNRTLAVGTLSGAEQALVSGTPSAADKDTIQFNFPVTDANRVYYQNDGVAGQVTLANVATTTAASDGGIGNIDPDWAHSWYSIRPTSALPSIFDAVIINGYSQSGATANTNAVGQGLNTVLRVELSGQNAGFVDGLLRLEDGDNTEIRGLALNRAQGAEIKLEFFAPGTTVQGNYIGSDISGTRAFPFTNPGSVPGYLRASGVYADSGGQIIGGTTPATRNLISGNNWQISALNSAIVLRGHSAPSFVQGNLIGTDRTGTVRLGNTSYGVLLDSPNNVIGGPSVAAGNVISGNDSGSISFASLNVVGTLVQNNKLGTDLTGTLPIGGINGITIVNTASNNEILDNIIAFGIGVNVGNGTSNLISRNSIFSNSGSGIDLGGDGVTRNDVPPASDPPDQDNGPNGRQNFPLLTAVTAIGGGTRIQGTLQSTPNSNFRLEFFGNSERDFNATNSLNNVVAGEFGEGEAYLGFLNVSTDDNGEFDFSIDLAGIDLIAMGKPFVTATATNITDTGSGPLNNTSEFSVVLPLGGASVVVSNTGDVGLGTLREAILNSILTPGLQTITFAIPANDPRHFYYANDNIAGHVSAANIATTTQANDASIVGIDPDWQNSWFSILPLEQFPEIRQQLAIDGYSQAGSSKNTLPSPQGLNTVLKIEIDGSNVAGPGFNLQVGAEVSRIEGLAINRFGGDGINLDTFGGNRVFGNFIGVDVSGTIDRGNGGAGIFLDGEAANRIGGTTPALRNLISGNTGAGIHLNLSGGDVIHGNLIGLNRSGTQTLVNSGPGILLVGASFETLGGAEAGAGNAIAAGAGDDAIAITVGADTGNPVGDIEDHENIRLQLVTIFEDRAQFFTTNTLADFETLDNSNFALLIAFVSEGIYGEARGNSILGNLTLVNGGTQDLGIDLASDGVSANDAGDGDEGPNATHNFPIITAAATIAGVTTLSGTLNSRASATYRIEFYSNAVGASYRGGRVFLGAINVSTNGSGNAAINFNSPVAVPAGQFVTATATRLVDLDENASTPLVALETSEFAAGVLVGTTGGPSTAPKDILVLGSAAGSDTKTRVKVIDAKTGQVLKTFTPYGNSFHGGVRVAIADLNNDGIAEIITAPGAGRDALVKVFDLNGVEKVDHRINAYPSTFTGGVFVAAGDVNGDGRVDIITTPGSGRAAEVKIWKNRIGIASSNPDPFANTPLQTFLAFGSTFTGGATVAAGDLTGDGKVEVVVGNGPGMAPTVRVFDTTTFATTGLAPRLREIKPFESADRGGVFVAVGNVRNSTTPEIIIGNGVNGRGRVEMYNADGTRFKSLNAYTDSSKNAPVHVAVKEIDNNDGALLEIVTSQGAAGSSKRRRTWQPDAALIDDVLETDTDFKYGYFIA